MFKFPVEVLIFRRRACLCFGRAAWKENIGFWLNHSKGLQAVAGSGGKRENDFSGIVGKRWKSDIFKRI